MRAELPPGYLFPRGSGGRLRVTSSGCELRTYVDDGPLSSLTILWAAGVAPGRRNRLRPTVSVYSVAEMRGRTAPVCSQKDLVVRHTLEDFRTDSRHRC